MSGLMSLVPWCLTARESSSKSRRDLALARDYLSSPGPLRTQEHSERVALLGGDSGDPSPPRRRTPSPRPAPSPPPEQRAEVRPAAARKAAARPSVNLASGDAVTRHACLRRLRHPASDSGHPATYPSSPWLDLLPPGMDLG